MRRKNTFVILLMMLFVVAAPLSGCGRGQRAATVNRKVITTQDLEKRIAYIELIYGHQLKGSQYQRARGEVLDSLIDEEMLIQEARRRGIKPKDAEVAKQYKDMISYLKKDVFGGSEAKYKAGLSKAGLTEQDLKDVLVRLLTERALFEEVTKAVYATPEEVKAIYDENTERFKRPEQVKMLEIRVNSLGEAQRALDEIKGGKDFAEVAKRLGMKDGGNRGYVARKSGLVQEIENVVFNLKVGETSGIIKSHYAYHIVKVEDHLPEKQITFDEVKDDLTKRVIDAKKQQKFDAFKEELSRKTKITREE